MILVDRELQKRHALGKPIRVGIVGAGFMCQGLTNQIENSIPAMRVAAISNRRLQRAVEVYKYSGHEEVIVADTQYRLDDAIREKPGSRNCSTRGLRQGALGRRQVGVTINICLKGHDKLSEGR